MSSVVTSRATANCCLLPKWPAYLGFDCLTILGMTGIWSIWPPPVKKAAFILRFSQNRPCGWDSEKPHWLLWDGYISRPQKLKWLLLRTSLFNCPHHFGIKVRTKFCDLRILAISDLVLVSQVEGSYSKATMGNDFWSQSTGTISGSPCYTAYNFDSDTENAASLRSTLDVQSCMLACISELMRLTLSVWFWRFWYATCPHQSLPHLL